MAFRSPDVAAGTTLCEHKWLVSEARGALIMNPPKCLGSGQSATRRRSPSNADACFAAGGRRAGVATFVPLIGGTWNTSARNQSAAKEPDQASVAPASVESMVGRERRITIASFAI